MSLPLIGWSGFLPGKSWVLRRAPCRGKRQVRVSRQRGEEQPHVSRIARRGVSFTFQEPRQRHGPLAAASAMFDESARLQFGHRLTQLLLRVHYDRTVPSHRFLDRLAGYKQEADSLWSSLDCQFVSPVKQYQRVIAGIVPGRCVGVSSLFSEHRTWIGGISECAGAREYIGKRIAGSLDLEPLMLSWRYKHVKITRLSGNSFDRSFLTPELAADNAHASAVIVSNLGNRAGRNILVTGIGHLQRGGQVRPQLETVHAPKLVAFGNFLVQDATAGGHPLHISGSHFPLVAQAVAVFDGTGKHVGDRLDSAVRMPRESRPVVLGIVVSEIVQQKKRIEFRGFSEPEGALHLHACAFDRWLRLNNLFHWSERHRFSLSCNAQKGGAYRAE